MAVPCWLRRTFEHYHIPYEVHRHPPAYTAAGLAHAEHVTGHRVAKTVFVSAYGRPVAVVLPAPRRLDLASVQAVVGDDLRLATEAEIRGWFPQCESPGAVPPLRLRADESILMDRSLAHLGDILLPAGTPEDAVSVRFRDWYRMVRPGVGRFALPAEPPKAATAPTILVVEDEAETNYLLCRLLERAGYACKGATDGSRALAMAEEQRPSAILLDLMLPDMSGFDVYERLRSQCPLRGTPPVLILTAMDDAASRERGQKMGADAYMVKPIMPDDLVAEISGALADARAC